MFDRRKFLTYATAAAGVAAIPKSAFAADTADVIIIGAGLSGLNAAMLLKEQGMRPIVLEANSIVGGRVRTHESVDGPVDVGASQIGRSYARVLDMVQKMNLKLIPEDRDLLPFGAHYQGAWIDNAKWADNPLNKTVGEERSIPPMLMAQRLVSKYNPFQDVTDWLDPKYASLDISLRQLLQSHGHSEQAIKLASLWPSGIDIDSTSVLRMWQEETRGAVDVSFGATGNTEEQHAGREQPFGEIHQRKLVNGLTSTSNIEGGCHRLPAAMAATLGDSVRLNKRVGRIEMSDKSGTVHCTDGTSYKARFIISAIPFTMLRQVKIEGGNGGTSPDAIAHMPYANTARLYLSVDPFWQEDGLPASFQTDGPLGMFWAIQNHQGGPTNRAMIVLTGPSARNISAKGKGSEQFLIDELARLRPASVGKVKIKTYKDWALDPLQMGCGFSFAPGQVNSFGRSMLEPWKIMHFAGEHTRRIDFGMESAMESGERAAIEIMARA
ncbi:flavin monoamine oxidase family protein [Sphingobium boeckii]|uniref:Monoamine oxidase n=1 Tax=Sphingobium boeckii TaxID=1082345 RepID=A0A7W9AIQ6_9SPHN|nr:NAD(P)/FAD-dependent oxidoreductase [Sphingobium boeckii]MBB5686385.1 monoamine oxidase [Sphingobium boeckii]